MRSIRFSLIIYFLGLIALALGAVSALVYQTTAATLREKQARTEQLLETQFQTQVQQSRLSLDQHLLSQARLLAAKARSESVPFETLFPVVAIGQSFVPINRVLAPVWMVDKTSSQISYRLPPWMRYEIVIPDTEFLVPMDEDRPSELFQMFRSRGAPAQRSPALRDNPFVLSVSTREHADVWREEYDEVPWNGALLRRVTVKAHVARSRVVPYIPVPMPYRMAVTKPKMPPPNSKGKNNGPVPQLPPPRPYDQTAPYFFIQYASDMAGLEAQIRQLQGERDLGLTQSHSEMVAALMDLRRRLGWIGVLTFAAIVAGGYVLLRIGLAPLARLSDAVSQVSEKNFNLPIDLQKLPQELRPVADRLRHILDQLAKAFAHEKQAAADISHELRTPLAALMTTLDVALRKPRTSEEYRELLEECRASGRHMSHLVERLMALARLDAGVERPSLEVCDLGELAQSCADMIRPLAQEQGLELRTQIADNLVGVSDAGKVRDVLINLLHNAIAYNKPAGSIKLTAERAGPEALLEVRDTGIGIVPEARAHLFERFYRADPSRHADTPHCGLGLAIVKSYVDLLGGTITVESTSAGTSFQVRVPLGMEEISTEEPADVTLEAVGS